MTFTKLSKIMIDELGTDKLSDIALEFGVSPQVVSNWKSRNQVPYKYVKKLRSIIKNQDNPNSKGSQTVLTNLNLNSNVVEDEPELVLKLLVEAIDLFKKNIKYILATTLFFTLSSSFYVLYVKTPLYKSESKIIPLNSQPKGGGIGALAQQFGVSVQSNKASSSLASAEMFPEILQSRSLMESLLLKKVSHKTFGENKSLISIILEEEKDKTDWTFKEKVRAINYLLKSIEVEKTRFSPLLTLTVTSKYPVLSAELLSMMISELKKRVRLHKLTNIQQTTSFISNRLKEIKISLEKKEEVLKEFRESNRIISSSPTLLLEQERLNREIATVNQIYGSLKIEYEKSKIEESRFDTVLEILDPPEISTRAININLLRSVVLAFLIGAAGSMFFIYFWNYYKNTMKLID